MSEAFDRAALEAGLVEAALAAGAAILAARARGVEARTKADASPVTEADEAAEAIILSALGRLASGVPVVAEEAAAAGSVPEVSERFFLVDPLDGTKEFVRGGDDFTVNIALVEQGRPTLGVVLAPARGALFVGDVARARAWRAAVEGSDLGAATLLRVRACGEAPVAVASKSHCTPETDAYLALHGVAERVSVGSSLKFCLVAGGEADLYPRAGPTMEWDTAAGHAVLEAAGGRVLDHEGGRLRYGKQHFFNPGFVAVGRLDPQPLSTVFRPEPA